MRNNRDVSVKKKKMHGGVFVALTASTGKRNLELTLNANPSLSVSLSSLSNLLEELVFLAIKWASLLNPSSRVVLRTK